MEISQGGKASKYLNLKKYRVYFKEQSNKKKYNVKKVTNIHGYNACNAETACEPKGLVYLFKVTIIIIKDMVTMKKVEDHSGTYFYKIFFYN